MLNTCLVSSLGLLFYFRMKEDSNFHSLMDAIHLRVECARLKFPDFIAKVSEHLAMAPGSSHNCLVSQKLILLRHRLQVMQRLSKYPLLLQGILKNTPKSSSFRAERHHLQNAVDHSKRFLDVRGATSLAGTCQPTAQKTRLPYSSHQPWPSSRWSISSSKSRSITSASCTSRSTLTLAPASQSISSLYGAVVWRRALTGLNPPCSLPPGAAAQSRLA